MAVQLGPHPLRDAAARTGDPRGRQGLPIQTTSDRFHLDQGEDALQSYRFNTHKIEHQFCRTCGTQPMALGALPDGTLSRGINLRCVPEADLDTLKRIPHDGASR